MECGSSVPLLTKSTASNRERDVHGFCRPLVLGYQRATSATREGERSCRHLESGAKPAHSISKEVFEKDHVGGVPQIRGNGATRLAGDNYLE